MFSENPLSTAGSELLQLFIALTLLAIVGGGLRASRDWLLNQSAPFKVATFSFLFVAISVAAFFLMGRFLPTIVYLILAAVLWFYARPSPADFGVYLQEQSQKRAQRKQKRIEDALLDTWDELQKKRVTAAPTAAPDEPDPTPTEEPEPPPDGVLVGTDADTNEPLYIPDELRGKHLYLIGKTRTGKTTLIKNLIIQTIEQSHGLCVIDPHGDMSEEVITNIPKERIKDVIYFDPTKEWCPAFNPLALPYRPDKLTADIISVFQLLFGSSWGNRMEHLLRYAVLTLIDSKEPTTFLDLRRMLTNEAHRERILAAVDDEEILEFWRDDYVGMAKDSAAPIINKLSSFLLPHSPMHRLFSNPANGLDFPAILREQKILIVNLAKGNVGEEPAKLLGAMVTAGIQQAALSLADTDPKKRKPFFLFIDEFQNFCTKSMEDILSESAKYKLFLTLAHQTLGQIPASMQHAILGNVATIVSFQISSEDAPTMAREMKRTRVLVREKGASSTIDPDDFMEHVRKKLTHPTGKFFLSACSMLWRGLHLPLPSKSFFSCRAGCVL